MTRRRVVLKFTFWILAAALNAEELTLDQAIQLAVKQNRGVQNAALDAAKAGEKLAQLRTKLLPALSLYALGSQQLRPIDFTLDRGIFGVYPGIGPVPAEDREFVRLCSPPVFCRDACYNRSRPYTGSG